MRLKLADFEGEWRVARWIFQPAGTAQFTGRAAFAPDGEGLRYHEEGLMQLPDVPPMRAERDYLWRARAGRIAVLFSDGRPFHIFRPEAPEAAHWCDPDTYRVRYSFGLWPEWQAEWRVQGPRKDYRMVSRYTPLRDAAFAGTSAP